MKRFLSPALLALALALTLPAAADTYVVDKGHSEAAFQVRHMVTKVRGRFLDFGGTIQVDPKNAEASSVELTFKTASVSSDNEGRDKDLRSPNFFDVEKYPTMTFKSSKIKKLGEDRYEVTGILDLRGVKKEIVVPVNFLGFVKTPWGGQVAGFEATVTLNRKDFGMVWNKALDNGGVLVGDDALITVNIEAKKSEAPAAK
ncbi:MAG TPA: YceI family protein [Thermoanaerobaculia bacterium]|nr:YceI family protein [Thermoanaerobaculia bacterium]